MTGMDTSSQGKKSAHEASPIGISVVIPTRGRAHLVRQLLESLNAARQSYAGSSEILVIDSSSGKERLDIERSCAAFGCALQHMPNNVREKRNWGITHARYPVVLFVDSDCIAGPSLLWEHARLYGQRDLAGLGGVVGLTRFVGKETWIWQIIKRTSTLDAFSYPERHSVVPWGPTCNMSYRRDVLEQVGLFDTSFPFALGGDDTDLGLRVTDSGFRLHTNVRAVVEHEKETWSSVSAISRRLARWGRMHFYMMRKHPHRLTPNPPTVAGVSLIMLLLFLPVGILTRSAAWASLPLVWLASELLIEALVVSYRRGPQPMEFLFALGAACLTLIFHLGTVFEGLRNRSLTPLYMDVSYCPPSPEGRRRGLAGLWAMVLAFPTALCILAVVQIACGTL